MKYLLLIYPNETAMPDTPKGLSTEMYAAYVAYAEAMKNAGVLVSLLQNSPCMEIFHCCGRKLGAQAAISGMIRLPRPTS